MIARITDLHPATPFELYPFGAAFLDKTPRVPHRVLDARLITHERHVADEHRAELRAADRLEMMDDLVHRDGERVLVAEHDHPEAVPDQDHLDAGRVLDPGGLVIVRGEHHDPLAAALHVEEHRNRDLVSTEHHTSQDGT